MWWLLSAWIAGVFVSLCSWQQAGWGLLPLGLLWCWRPCRQSRLAPLILVFAGLLLSQWFLGRQLERWLPVSLDGGTFLLSGRVIDLPVWREAQAGRPPVSQLQLDEVQLLEGKDRWPGIHQLRLTDNNARDYRPGDRLVLRARLFRPRGFVNEGSPDSARLALARGEDARGYLVELQEQAPGFAPVDQWRDRLSRRMQAQLAAYPEAAGLIPALTVGDWRWLPAPSWRLYQQSGTAHLVVISGEHLTLVAGFLWLLLRYLCVPLLLWRGWQVSAQQWALLPALLLATGYCLLAGWSVSTLRALLMLTVWAGCRLFRQRWPKQRVLALALLAVLLWQPLSPLGNGFWLSFLAVGLLLLVVEARPGMVLLQATMSLVIGALAAWMFGQWGPVSVIANLLLIPLFSFVLVPSALLGGLVPGCGWLLSLIAPLVAWQERLLAWLLDVIPMLSPPSGLPAMLLLMLALLLALIRFLPWPRRALPFLLLPWLFPWQASLDDGDFELVLFDVGQGQASLVRTRTGVVLYDMGPAWSGSDAGGSVVLPWLRGRQLPVLLAFASHGDADHVGGLAGLADQLPAGSLRAGEPARTTGSMACESGQHWRFSGVDFRVLWPPAGLATDVANARSCVLLVEGKRGSVLLTGDIPKPVEFWLATHADVRARVLQLPHHGSASSSSYAFLRAVAPELALAGVGHLNRPGHPAVETQRRLLDLGIPLLRTDRDGMLRLTFDVEKNIRVERERDRHRPWEDAGQAMPLLPARSAMHDN